MNNESQDRIVEQIRAAQLSLVEMTLVAWLEDLLGRVPSDPEILAKGFHAPFADTPISVYEKDGCRFVSYYVWENEHAVALGFLDPQLPLDLTIVRVPKEEWPLALKLLVEQHEKET